MTADAFPLAPASTGKDRREKPVRRKPEQTRERILRAAVSEFAQHGFAGARIDRILKKSRANPRMLYHHFGGKSELYVTVLEGALGDLRSQELQLDVERLNPIEGLLRLFDFINDHFEANQHLVSLLTTENLLGARFMRKSARIHKMSSPVLAMIGRFLAAGTASGEIAAGLDPLRTYVLMVALSQFHISNVHTLSFIFDTDLSRKEWRTKRKADARRMLRALLRDFPSSEEAAKAP